MPVEINIPSLGNKFQDYRTDIPGDSFNWGPEITATNVKYFALHHSVTAQTAKNDGNWKAECDVIANEHLAEGWGGIGYRFVICSDGTVAYVGDLSHGGSAVAGNNDIIFSACLVGDFTKELPTAAQVHSAHILADFFVNHMPQYPAIANWDSLIGHKDAFELLHLPGATATACPGPAWRDPNDALRERVINDSFTGYPDPQPAGTVQPTPAPVPDPVPSPAPTPNPAPTPDPDLANQIAGLKARNTDLTNKLALANAEVQNREEQVGRLKDQVTTDDTLRKGLVDQVNSATKKLDSITQTYEGQLKVKQGVIDDQGKKLGALNGQNAVLTQSLQSCKANGVASLTIAELLSFAMKKLGGR